LIAKNRPESDGAAMNINRRTLLTTAAAMPASVLAARIGLAAPAPANSLSAAQFGVRSGIEQDQSRALQKAIDQAASRRLPLFLPPGRYRAAELRLPEN
jgi:hypothetical protein